MVRQSPDNLNIEFRKDAAYDNQGQPYSTNDPFRTVHLELAARLQNAETALRHARVSESRDERGERRIVHVDADARGDGGGDGGGHDAPL